MIDNSWNSLPHTHKIALLLALVGVVYLFMQTGTAPIQLSNWNGESANSVAGASLLTRQQGISGVAQAQPPRAEATFDTPSGNPLGVPNMVMTQGYGVGSHAPAAVWGGVDLAIDGDGDGQADPGGSMGAPIYATHAGIAYVKPDTWPAGNYLSIEGERFKTAFAHLKEYAVQDGERVEPGQIIAYVGSTGNSSGPHLHYEVWQDGQNVNPLDFGALDGTQ